MNILFLSLSNLGDINKKGLYRDLIRFFLSQQHSVTVVYPVEKREGKQTSFDVDGSLSQLSVKTGNITKCKNLLEKGVSTLLLEHQYISAIKTYCSDIHYDLVLYVTPPITFSNVVSFIKKRDGSKSYLMLKDIFPQNALDIQLLPSHGIWRLATRWFQHKEQVLYQVSDYIGCMSPRNVEYLIAHNPKLATNRIEVCPNSIEPMERLGTRLINNKQGKVTFLYGGNLGKPQGIPFFIDCLKDNINKLDREFIICGTGTELPLLQSFMEEYQPTNITLIPGLPVEEYEKLVVSCDVGMILLDHRFAIPNFPSRILSYMEKSLPVFACTDTSTDMGTIITEGNFGWWCESNDTAGFTEVVDRICSTDFDSIHELGQNARDYLEGHYTVEKTYDIIMKHFLKDTLHV